MSAEWYNESGILPGPRHVRLSNEEAEPILPWRLSGYRLLSLVILISMGTAKAVASKQDRAVVGNTLDWVLGVLAAAGLFILGWGETTENSRWSLFYGKDYRPLALYLLAGTLLPAGAGIICVIMGLTPTMFSFAKYPGMPYIVQRLVEFFWQFWAFFWGCITFFPTMAFDPYWLIVDLFASSSRFRDEGPGIMIFLRFVCFGFGTYTGMYILDTIQI